tara:strand:+ start:3924 stop:4286 length:363 start_codon:yes stop_codon:yes gene_type:complete
MKIGKYQYKDENTVLSKIKLLGVNTDEEGKEHASHKHTIVKLGYIVLQAALYDTDGEQTQEAILSDKYHVDVCWRLSDTYSEDGQLIKAKDPYGWKSSKIDLDNNGVHSFFGIDYLTNKI